VSWCSATAASSGTHRDAISEEAIVDASFMNKLAADADQTAAPRWNRPWSQRLVAAVPFIALAGVLA